MLESSVKRSLMRPSLSLSYSRSTFLSSLFAVVSAVVTEIWIASREAEKGETHKCEANQGEHPPHPHLLVEPRLNLMLVSLGAVSLLTRTSPPTFHLHHIPYKLRLHYNFIPTTTVTTKNINNRYAYSRTKPPTIYCGVLIALARTHQSHHGFQGRLVVPLLVAVSYLLTQYSCRWRIRRNWTSEYIFD